MSLNHYAILQIHKDQLTETTAVSEYFLSSHSASDYRQKKKKERKTYFVSTIVAALIGGSMNLTPA